MFNVWEIFKYSFIVIIFLKNIKYIKTIKQSDDIIKCHVFSYMNLFIYLFIFKESPQTLIIEKINYMFI